MAARNRSWTPEKVRQRIRTSMLVKRLKDHVVGRVDMSPTQIRAAEILLKKALPDLSAVEHSGEIGSVGKLSDADLEQQIRDLASQLGIAGTPAREEKTH